MNLNYQDYLDCKHSSELNDKYPCDSDCGNDDLNFKIIGLNAIVFCLLIYGLMN